MTVEQLLNKLIEKGWRPYEDRYVKRAKFGYSVHFIVRPIVNFVLEGYAEATVPLKELLTSEESGFRQFVCENGMYKKEALGIYFNDERAKNVFYKIDQFDEEGDVIQTGAMEGDRFIHMSEPEYRLIESSLRNKNELEDFLLQNIRIEDESNQNT